MHCGGEGRLQIVGPDSAGCARVCVRGYARACLSMQEYARVCASMPEFARVCAGTREYVQVCAGMRGNVRACTRMREHSHLALMSTRAQVHAVFFAGSAACHKRYMPRLGIICFAAPPGVPTSSTATVLAANNLYHKEGKMPVATKNSALRNTSVGLGALRELQDNLSFAIRPHSLRKLRARLCIHQGLSR